MLQDTIPQHAYVCTYIGEVYDRETHEHLVRARSGGGGLRRWLMTPCMLPLSVICARVSSSPFALTPLIWPAAPQVRTVEEQDAEYTFDMACRQETNWDGTETEREE